MAEPILRIGTRGSPLALAQAREVASRLARAHGWPEDAAPVEIVPIVTTGDRITDRPLNEVGGKGLFTKEIEEALFAGKIDLAVHSMKDLPGHLPPGLGIAAVLEREDPRDAFLSPVAASLTHLPMGARLGTTSLRRRAQLLAARPDLEIVTFRGNVDTRLAKMAAGEVAATVLAVAGLARLGRTDAISSVFDPDIMLPAVAQGAIGIEIREDDARTRALITAINHAPSAVAVTAERAFLSLVDGDCKTPIAALAVLENPADPEGSPLTLRAAIFSPDGRQRFAATRTGPGRDALALGREAGEAILARAGADFLRMLKDGA